MGCLYPSRVSTGRCRSDQGPPASHKWRWAERHTQPREELSRPRWKEGSHVKILFAEESNLQEVWHSKSSSEEDLKSEPMFLTSIVIA